MKLIELNTNPSRKDLAWFGLILLAVGGVVGMLVWRATGSLIPPFSIWIASSVLTATYYVVPGLRRPMFLAWMYVTYPVGWVVSHTLLAVLYFTTKTNRVGLFWAAFILTRPLGATVGDFLDKPMAKGGLEFSRPLATAILALAIVALVVLLPQRPASRPKAAAV